MSTLAAVLLRKAAAPLETIEQAMLRQSLYGGDLATNLLELGVISEETLVPLIAEATGLPPSAVGPLPTPSDSVRRWLSPELAARHGVVPVGAVDGGLLVAVAVPLNASTVDDLSHSLGLVLSIQVTTEVRVREGLWRNYGLEPSPRMQLLLASLAPASVLVPATMAGSKPAELAAPLTELSGGAPPLSAPSPSSSSAPDSAETVTLVHGAAVAAPTSASPRAPQLSKDSAARASLAATGSAPSAGRRRLGPFTAKMAESELSNVRSPLELATIWLDFASQYFEYVALFAVQGDIAAGRVARGAGTTGVAFAHLGVPLDLPSVLQRARHAKTWQLGPLQPRGLDATLARDMARPMGHQVLTIPLAVQGRVVLVLYGDHGRHDVDLELVGDMLAFTPLVERALTRLVVERKRGNRAERGLARHEPAPKVSLPPPEARATTLAAALQRSVHPPQGDFVRAATLAEPHNHAVHEELTAPAPTVLPWGALPNEDGPGRVQPSVQPPLSEPSEVAASSRITTVISVAPPAEAPIHPSPSIPVGARDLPLAITAPTLPDAIERTATLLSSAAPPPGQSAPPQQASFADSDDAWDLVRPILDVGFEDAPSEATELAATANGAATSSPDAKGLDPFELNWDSQSHESERPVESRTRPGMTSRLELVVDADAPSSRPSAGDATESERLPASRAEAHAPIVPAREAQSRELALPSVVVEPELACSQAISRWLDGAAGALDEVVAFGDIAASLLARDLPGPVNPPSRTPRSGEPVRASDCGALMGALAALSTVARPYVIARTSDVDATVRMWSTRLLGELPGRQSAIAVARRLVQDRDPDVRRAAFAAGQLLGNDPDSHESLRHALLETAGDPKQLVTTRLVALDGLSDLRLAAAIPALVELLQDSNPGIAAASQQALVVLSRQDFGFDQAAWHDWWTSHRHLHRIEWVIDALTHPSATVREPAAEELRGTTRLYVGTWDDSDPSERLRIQQKYRDWLHSPTRLSQTPRSER